MFNLRQEIAALELLLLRDLAAQNLTLSTRKSRLEELETKRHLLALRELLDRPQDARERRRK